MSVSTRAAESPSPLPMPSKHARILSAHLTDTMLRVVSGWRTWQTDSAPRVVPLLLHAFHHHLSGLGSSSWSDVTCVVTHSILSWPCSLAVFWQLDVDIPVHLTFVFSKYLLMRRNTIWILGWLIESTMINHIKFYNLLPRQINPIKFNISIDFWLSIDLAHFLKNPFES